MKNELYRVIKVSLTPKPKRKCVGKFKCKERAYKFMVKQERKHYDEGQHTFFCVMKK